MEIKLKKYLKMLKSSSPWLVKNDKILKKMRKKNTKKMKKMKKNEKKCKKIRKKF